jgi:hypothetical protein
MLQKMRTSSNLLLLFVGSLAGCTAICSAYVTLTHAFMVPNDPSTWPHMAVERFYFFIPFFAAWAFAIGVLAEFLLFQKLGFHLRWPGAWALLGIAYSAVWLFYCLSFALPRGPYLLAVSYIMAAACAWLVHIIFHVRRASVA